MHELGVVFHVINKVEDIAKANNADRIDLVTLQLGEVSTVIPYLLEDCWNWAVKKSEILKGCKLKIETIPAITYCENCGGEYETVKYAKICPYCKSDRTYLKQGNEFIIKDVQVIED
jgi:hydrogenase nickel incorporation protein HypA/HybF